MANNRFDLEQQILDAWKVTDELNLVYGAVMDTNLTQDEIANLLLGMKSMYELKFNRLWDTFEECIHNKEI